MGTIPRGYAKGVSDLSPVKYAGYYPEGVVDPRLTAGRYRGVVESVWQRQ